MLKFLEKSQYTVVIEQDEDGFFVASVPALPGCRTQGKTLAELRRNVKDAIKLCLVVAKTDVNYRKQVQALSNQPGFVALETVQV